MALSAIWALAWTSPGAVPQTDDGPLEPRLVLRESRHAPSNTTLKVGKFRVWEDREACAGRVLELDVVVLPALGQERKPDPVFVFAGGPGQNAAWHHGRWATHWMRQKRDIVLVSQRGTGGDNRLICELPGNDDHPQGYLDPVFQERTFRACLARLKKRFDLSKYSTPIAMDDINDVRAALGYEKINLYGGSYGSRAELVYIRRHPATVRTAILNSVAPIAFTNPLYHARGAQEALDLILNECANDPACRKAFGDLRAKFRTVLARLDAGPVDATVRHPKTGKPVSVKLSRYGFADALRIIMYYNSRDVPLLIHRAFEGDYGYFAQRGMEADRSIRQSLAFGMLLCVTCGEDVSRIDAKSIAGHTEGTFLGDGRVRRQMTICDFWPDSDVPQDYAKPVSSDVPVLLLSGTLDSVTPPRWGAEAARHLKNSLHVVVPGSHGVGGPCLESLMRDFLERGGAADLDTSCVAQIRLPPFTLGKRELRP